VDRIPGEKEKTLTVILNLFQDLSGD